MHASRGRTVAHGANALAVRTVQSNAPKGNRTREMDYYL